MAETVSICIPTYNNADYINETLNSLLNQSCHNVEIIISNNASTDNTDQIVNEYLSNYNNIKYNVNSLNIGYVGNIKSCVDISSGNFIAIYHSDDIYHETIVEKELQVLLNNPDIDAVFTLSSMFYMNTGKIIKSEICNSMIKASVEYRISDNIFVFDYKSALKTLTTKGNYFVCPSFMTRKKIYVELGGFTDDYPSNEDLHLWLRYLKSGKRIAIINEHLIKYRISPTQVSNYYLKQNSINLFFKVIEDQVLCDLNEEDLNNFNKLKSSAMISVAKRRYLAGCPDDANEMIKESIKQYYFKLFTVKGLLQRYFKYLIPLINIKRKLFQ